MAELRSELTRTLLAAIFLGGLIVASLWILRPFIAAVIWATMIVVATPGRCCSGSSSACGNAGGLPSWR